MNLIAIHTTVGTRAQAQHMARTLVERRLAACAEISEIESFYSWKGAIQNEPEFRLVLKTTEARYEAAEAAIVELHPYELPAVHAVPLAHVHGPYARWVEDGTSIGIDGAS